MDQPAQQVTEQTADTTSQATQTQQEQSPDFAKRIALLSKKEASTLSMKKQIDEERSTFLKEKEDLSKKASFAEKVKNRDWKALDELGFDLSDYLKYKEGGEKPTQETMLMKMREELREELRQEIAKEKDSYKKEMEENYKKANENVMSEFKKDIKTLLDKDAQAEKRWELLYSYENAEAEVAQYITDFYNNKGVRLTPQEAADELEKYLFEQESAKITKFNKLKRHAEETLKPQPTVQDAKKPNTLTSTMTSNTPSADRTKFSVEKSLQEAAKSLRWT